MGGGRLREVVAKGGSTVFNIGLAATGGARTSVLFNKRRLVYLLVIVNLCSFPHGRLLSKPLKCIHNSIVGRYTLTIS